MKKETGTEGMAKVKGVEVCKGGGGVQGCVCVQGGCVEGAGGG